MATVTKPCFLRFLLFLSSPTIIQSPGFYKWLWILHRWKQILVDDFPTYIFALQFCYLLITPNCYLLITPRINTRSHIKEKPNMINSYFCKIGKAKKSIGWAKYVYLCKCLSFWLGRNSKAFRQIELLPTPAICSEGRGVVGYKTGLTHQSLVPSPKTSEPTILDR